jgi:uncharacterized damage-inducible protein DinB
MVTIPIVAPILETYTSETQKAAAVFREFRVEDLEYRPHPRSSTVFDIMKHQLLSERRFFAEFLGSPEPEAAKVLPEERSPAALAARFEELARPRVEFLSEQDESWWLEERPFFDVERTRLWILLRRYLHSAHHRTQLTVYLRMLNRKLISVYGPTADVTWAGADPTISVEAAGRKG